jgi:hypothetical protein
LGHSATETSSAAEDIVHHKALSVDNEKAEWYQKKHTMMLGSAKDRMGNVCQISKLIPDDFFTTIIIMEFLVQVPSQLAWWFHTDVGLALNPLSL